MEELSAYERKRALEALRESAGWHIIKGVLVEQVHSRTETLILAPVEGLDQTFAQEYAKGEIAGIRLAQAMIGLLIDEAAEELETEQDKEDE